MSNVRRILRMVTLRPRNRGPDPMAALPRPWAEAGDGPRVVVENEDATWQWAATETLEAAGYEVACCGGPYHLPHQLCPLVTDDRCPLIDGADLVINGLGIGDPTNRAVLTALRTQREQTPVLVEIGTTQLAELHTEIPGCRTVPFPVRPKDLIAGVSDVIRGNREC